jgi:hypothetical protein
MASKMGRPTGPEGARNAVIGVRVTPKVKFGLDLLSRLHRASLPDLLTIAINDLFSSERFGLWDVVPGQGPTPDDEVPTHRNLLNHLWAERSSDRFANIALKKRSLLLMTEGRLWSHIEGIPKYWSHQTRRNEEDLQRDVLAEDWESLKAEHLPLGIV